MIFDKIRSLFSKKGKGGSTNKIHEGVVKRVQFKKGFGFISCPDFDKLIFVHFTDSKSRLKVGRKVKFRVNETEKGLRAVEVEVIGQS